MQETKMNKGMMTEISEYVELCHQLVSNTDYLAGERLVPTELIEKYKLGFDAGANAVIIPIGDCSYLKRNLNWTSKGSGASKYAFSKGASTVFNLDLLKNTDEPIFIVEGVFDGLSIEAVFPEAKFVAINNAHVPQKIWDLLGKHPRKAPFILSLDKDKRGQEGQEAFGKELQKRGVPYIEADLAGDYKDANEAYVADQENQFENFRGRVVAALKSAEEYEPVKNASVKDTSAEDLFTADTPVKNTLAVVSDEFSFVPDYKSLGGFLKEIEQEEQLELISTGFSSLDEYFGGGLREELYVLGAGSSMGKTTLMLQIANFISSKRPVMFFSLEMPQKSLRARILSRFTAVLDETPGRKNAKTMIGILQGERRKPYSQAERRLRAKALMKYRNELKGFILFTDSRFCNIEVIDRCIETYVQQKELAPVIFIDYLQFLIPDKPYGTDKQNVDRVIKWLKRLSVTYSTPVFAISSVNRSSYSRPIGMDSLKESGNIEYESDVVLGLDFQESADPEEKNKDPRKIRLTILKNRDGPLGQIDFELYSKFNLFLEKEKSVNQDEEPKKIKKISLKKAG